MNKPSATTRASLPTPVVVESVVALTDQEIKELTQLFQAKFGQVQMETKLNPLLIGGLKISLKNQTIDLSLKNRLEIIETNVLNHAVTKS